MMLLIIFGLYALLGFIVHDIGTRMIDRPTSPFIFLWMTTLWPVAIGTIAVAVWNDDGIENV